MTAQVAECALSHHLEDFEPRLTRQGYGVRALAEQFSAKPAEIRQFFGCELDPTRTQELSQRMQAAGLPI